MPATRVIPAVPVERIVDPTCVRTIRRSPKWSAPDRADNAADHSTGGSSDQKPSPGAECCANSIGSRNSRSSKQKDWCRGQQNSAHELSPIARVEFESVALQRPAKHVRAIYFRRVQMATAPTAGRMVITALITVSCEPPPGTYHLCGQPFVCRIRQIRFAGRAGNSLEGFPVSILSGCRPEKTAPAWETKAKPSVMPKPRRLCCLCHDVTIRSVMRITE